MSTDTVFGGPTKRLFVSMLTRDIELVDAILDLIDNCVDGAMRQNPDDLDSDTVFDGFESKLSLDKDKFEISDNCGGIPKDYIDDAFSLGRPNITQDGNLPTIGMYGIGMKRAIFKMTTRAAVSSNHKDGFAQVDYSAEWLNPENDKDWHLPIIREESKDEIHGVSILADALKDEISDKFASDWFLNELKQHISENFGYIMQRGFKIVVNNEELEPHTLPLRSQEWSDQPGIRPFDYEAIIEGVSIKVTVGFFRPLVRDQEIDDEAESPQESMERAGVSVVCNDRIVLLYDRSQKSGWGGSGLPRFHPQFRAIAGIIVLSSNAADKLPISTTKRDLDIGSDIYLTARDACIEGLKMFTNFTNKWKGMEDQTTKFFEAAKKVDARKSINLAKDHGASVRGQEGAKKYRPNLPVPEKRNKQKRISFIRDEDDIKAVSQHLFDEENQPPKIVGEECFDRALAKSKNG